MMAIYNYPVILVYQRCDWLVRVYIIAIRLFEELLSLSLVADSAELSSSTVSDTDLKDISLSLSGDSQAYRRIIERYQQHVGKILWKFTRDEPTHEDLVQDAFVEAYLSLGTYKSKAPLSHWLAKIAVRVGYRYWKCQERKKKTEHFTFEQWDQIAQKNSIEEITPSAAAELLHKLFAQMLPRDRLVLTLRYFEGCSIEETARRTGWTKSMVKVQSWRARNKLKKLFIEKNRDIEL